MNARLVLAGLVASLGLSVPGWPDIEGAFRSFQDWGVARLANWDARRTTRTNFIRVPDWIGAEGEGPISSAMDRAAIDETRAPSAFEPIVASEEREDDIATALNRMADGQGVLPVFVSSEGGVPPRGVDGRFGPCGGEGATWSGWDRPDSAGPIERRIGLELARAVQEAAAESAGAGPREPFSERSCRVDAAIVDLLDHEVVRTGPRRVSLSESHRSTSAAPPLPEIPADPWAPSEASAVAASALASSPLPEIPADPWAPSTTVPAHRKGPSVTVRDERLRHALELTRAAARAWMSALGGQAAVRVSAPAGPLALVSSETASHSPPAPLAGTPRLLGRDRPR